MRPEALSPGGHIFSPLPSPLLLQEIFPLKHPSHFPSAHIHSGIQHPHQRGAREMIHIERVNLLL